MTFDDPVRLRVRYVETDKMGVVNHANYLFYCEVGRSELMRARGLPYSEVEAQGFTLAVLEAHLNYRGSVVYDDEIAVHTAVSMPTGAKIRFDYRIERLRDNCIVTRGHTLHAVLGPSGKPVRVPDAVCQVIKNGPRNAPPDRKP